MNFQDLIRIEGRRAFLRDCAGGIGTIALSHLLAIEGRTAETDAKDPLAVKPPHFPGKAKNVIWLQMIGGMSHIDTLDPKTGDTKGAKGPIKTKADFQLGGYLTNLAGQADKIAVIRSMRTSQVDHPGGIHLMHTGYAESANTRFPEIGAITAKYLGREATDLPNFIKISS